jgi:hypothetical protein
MSDDERARLEAAGLVAPIVRGMDETTLRRRVHTYDRETGEPVREVTVRQLIGGLAKVTALEVEVIEGKRPNEVPCELCGKSLSVRATGAIPRHCPMNAGGCERQSHCAGGCGKRTAGDAFNKSKRLARNGAPWMCPVCSRNVEKKPIVDCARPPTELEMLTLSYLEDDIRTGRPSSMREMGAFFGASAAAIFYRIVALERKGLISRMRGLARAISVTPLGLSTVERWRATNDHGLPQKTSPND